MPLSSALPVDVVPSGKRTVTSDPASALPVMASSSLFTSSAVGASGAVLSATVVVVLSEVLPAWSVAVTSSSSPPCKSTSLGILTV